MKYRISKKFAFSASHALTLLPKEHKCHRLHGHNYTVEVVLEVEKLDSLGMVRDFAELDGLKYYIDKTFDHRHLNEIFGSYTTSEKLAEHFYQWCKERWPETKIVRVSETDKTYAECSE